MLKAQSRTELTLKAQVLKTEHFAVKPIFHPTVPAEMEGIRMSMHSFNTVEEIERFSAKILELSPI
jgi:8-amino-7-oxononanoate synthase